MKRLISAVLCGILLVSCDPVVRDGAAVPKKDINAVLQTHTAELMAIPGVTGVAISELEDKTPCIWVLVLEKSEELDRKIPDSLDGHPVKVVVSGEIKPLDGQ